MRTDKNSRKDNKSNTYDGGPDTKLNIISDSVTPTPPTNSKIMNEISAERSVGLRKKKKKCAFAILLCVSRSLELKPLPFCILRTVAAFPSFSNLGIGQKL